jgi:hypothetical protein
MTDQFTLLLALALLHAPTDAIPILQALLTLAFLPRSISNVTTSVKPPSSGRIHISFKNNNRYKDENKNNFLLPPETLSNIPHIFSYSTKQLP